MKLVGDKVAAFVRHEQLQHDDGYNWWNELIPCTPFEEYQEKSTQRKKEGIVLESQTLIFFSGIGVFANSDGAQFILQKLSSRFGKSHNTGAALSVNVLPPFLTTSEELL